MPEFLHDRKDFEQLLAVVADQRSLDPILVEKDYWIMHGLWGLQAQGFQFELKGGTSLSKGFGVIHRFSEDIDIRIEPPQGMAVKTGRNHDRVAHIASRRNFYDWLATEIRIPGISLVERDTFFDDDKLRSAGIRLSYSSRNPAMAGVKDGILLELGFDDTTPIDRSPSVRGRGTQRACRVCRRSITGQSTSCVTPRPTPLSRSCRRFRPNKGVWVKHKPFRATFCATTMTCTACWTSKKSRFS